MFERTPLFTMFARSALRASGGGRTQCLTRSFGTSLSSTIKLQHVPAPHAGSITVLSLNRPRSRNALSRQLLSELNEIIEGLHAEQARGGTRALVLASESDDAFCAGADLKERVAMTRDEYDDYRSQPMQHRPA